jgi:hypothetical protein
MCNKELAAKAVNIVLRKTFGRLDVAKQYRIAARFGFSRNDQNSQPAYPEYHFPVQNPPDDLISHADQSDPNEFLLK